MWYIQSLGKEHLMNYSADQVWGLAVAADRVNGGYFKEDEWNTSTSAHFISREANKKMVKRWLREGAVSEASADDMEQGRAVRHFFNGFLLKELSGKINDFERQALRIAQIDEFTGRNMLEFAIVSCLPSAMIREQSRKELASDIRNSTQLTGSVGDRIEGEVEIIKCFYSQDYAKFRITARLVDSFVDFWYNTSMEAGSRVNIRGKIKTCRSDFTTQLNYVKIS